MAFDFAGKVAVVTGGSNGIGLCTAEEFKKAGAKVAVIDLVPPQKGEFDFFFKGDLANEEDLEAFVKGVVEKYGKVDFLVNNACISRAGILSNCGYEDFLYVLKVGLAAPYMLTKLFLPFFDRDGAIVNISSTRAFQSQPDTESYTAAKGGITALTHALAVSLAGKVRVNCISPGWIDTQNSDFEVADMLQHPAGIVGKPIDIAGMVMYLCSDRARFINGENIRIDGGMSKLMIYHNDHGWEYKPEKAE